MLIIKLGGSMITYKRDDLNLPYVENETGWTYRVKEHMIRKVGQVLRRHMDGGLILVHGGGTHGHRTVNRWRKGIARGPESMMVWEVKWRMDQLTNSIVRVLGDQRIPAVSHPTSGFVISDDGRIARMETGNLEEIIDRNCVPVVRGDLCPDLNGGWSVVSGDNLIEKLCAHFIKSGRIISKVIMLMDVEGIIDPNGNIIDTMTMENLVKLESEAGNTIQAREGDVSGGIKGKIQTCLKLSKMGIESFIAGGDVETNLEKILEGGSAGTRFPSGMEDKG